MYIQTMENDNVLCWTLFNVIIVSHIAVIKRMSTRGRGPIDVLHLLITQA